ncbi:NAD/NADP octopine/nopaline dehydrogenase family protein [Salinicoccus hispanicus]|uniref:6-phosphogluconate dehydrogenase, decarboxylating n=1 Tax=Salinicoccus hispanicus TaxID=157225 RepID=A0A6N8U1B5_9STAP|nr:NAD/NADP-dependent octopine/nopaline dehydrogenase family protein [Salinicoccus hispanicus]MXQ51870.1 NAD(P)-binding domain-containing protein [Salinicoccus hispanicus]
MGLKISIFGAGHGGITAAVDMTERGHTVTLYQSPQSRKDLSKIEETGEINFKGSPVKIHRFTREISEAVHGHDVLMLAIPSTAVEPVAENIAPYLEDGQYVLINSASAMCSIRFKRVLHNMKADVDVKVGETMSLTYASRYHPERNEAELIGYNKHNLFAAYPSRHTEEMLEVFNRMYDHLKPAENIIETTLNNGNPESHPGPSILNAGRIDYAGDQFYLYKEGITEHTVNVIHRIDQERQAICEALGFEVLSKSKRSVRSGYFEESESLREQYNNSKILREILGPTDLENRYVTEDVSNGLVLWASIGDMVGVDTPVMDSIITLAGVLLERDYFKEGVTLSKLGIEKVNSEELNQLMKYDSTRD